MQTLHVFIIFLKTVLGHANTTRIYYLLKNSNRTPHEPPKLDLETRELLYEFYEQEIDNLQNTISTNLSHWKTHHTQTLLC